MGNWRNVNKSNNHVATKRWFGSSLPRLAFLIFTAEFGNLSFQTTESDIRAAFEHYGPVESVSIITDRDTGRSKGFGFVEMSEEDANKAIAGLSGSQLDGRALTVNEAKPMVKRDFGGGGSRGGGRRDRY